MEQHKRLGAGSLLNSIDREVLSFIASKPEISRQYQLQR